MAEVPWEIGVQETDARLRSGTGERPRLIDVRDPDEYGFCRIEGAELIPLATLPAEAAAKLGDRAAEIIVYCHHGMRSMRAVQHLRALGYANARSMAGGIDAWSEEIDPSVGRY